jgi:hypothetical protein
VASVAVLAAIFVIACRSLAGLRSARVPFGVSLHVALAFLNMLGAGGIGVALAAAKLWGLAGWSPLAAAAAHAHVAVLGWGVMMIIGISYRLVPMFLPAAMPSRASIAWSAILLEIGTLGLAWALASGSNAIPWALVIVAAFGTFFGHVRAILAQRRPRPAEMQGRDWSTWQSHAALLYLAVATAVGLALGGGVVAASWVWAYGVAGILGFVAQMVVGIQGRLLPLHAWYRAMTQLEGEPPARSVHCLANGRATSSIFALWLVAVPMLIAGLMTEQQGFIATAAALLCGSTMLQAAHMVHMVRRARST